MRVSHLPMKKMMQSFPGDQLMQLDFKSLKEKHRRVREDFSTSLALRTHRALSWLQRAEKESEDPDARFIFLWIAFNAAYANEIHDRKLFSEQKVVRNFMERLINSDKERMIYRILWEEFPGAIRVLIDNQYVFGPFWDFHKGLISEESWKSRFEHSKSIAHAAIGRMESAKVLSVIFDRLYTLRNQLIHGSATWNSSVNREQIRDGVKIMDRLVPTVIHLMMANPNQLWGEPQYPVVK